MKKQTGFISSSSSVSIKYSTFYGGWQSGDSSISWSNVQAEFSKITDQHDGKTWTTTSALTPNTNTTSIISWKTFTNKSYQRIEYFLEAVEKLKSPFSKNEKTFLNLKNYSSTVGAKDLYNGFVDIVITFPVEVRLAGIELLNPWINKLTNDNDSNNWMYLPSKFIIYKVDDSQLNAVLEKLSYDNDIARKKTGIGDTDYEVYRPIRYDQIENDQKLIFLGKYDVYWKNKASYKCFFKFNELDPASLNLKTNSDNAGTATWKCKQLVLRIFKTYNSDNIDSSSIKEKIESFIFNTELKLGTKVAGNDITLENAKTLYDKRLEIKERKSRNSSKWK